MNTKEHLIEQHIREYESRLKHVDELFVQAHSLTEHLDEAHESRSELDDYRDKAKTFLDARHDEDESEIQTMTVDKWRQETSKAAGPMALWDILAQKLEDFIERHE